MATNTLPRLLILEIWKQRYRYFFYGMFLPGHFIPNTFSLLADNPEQFSKKVFLNEKRSYICSPKTTVTPFTA